MSSSKYYLKVKDHSVSGEEFELLIDETVDMLVTTPQPRQETLGDYYKSEDYISHTNSKRNLFERAYHFVRRITLSQKLRLINTLGTSEKSLLDVGCGTGDFIAFSKAGGWSVTGIEPNERARTIAQQKLKGSIYDSDYLLGLGEGTFNVITLWHVLEHLPNLQDHINLFKHALVSDGYLIVAVPNFKSYDAKYYKEFWAAYDAPRHLWHFSREGIKSIFEQNGFYLEKELPMKFDAFYVSLLSEKYKTGRMNPVKAFCLGLISNLKAIRSKEHSSIIYVLKKTDS